MSGRGTNRGPGFHEARRGRRAHGRFSWIVLLSAALVWPIGCQSGSSRRERLPEEPIAFVHWEGKAARKRGEAFANVGEMPPDPPDPRDPEGQQERSIRAYLEAQHSITLAAKVAKYTGYLTLLWPRTGEIERVEAAPANARPLAWNADHTRLLFVSTHREGRRQIYEYDLARKELSVLTTGPAEHPRADYLPAGMPTRGARKAGGPVAATDGPAPGASVPAGALVIQRTASQGLGRPIQTAHLATSSGRFLALLGEGVRASSLRLLPGAAGIVYEQVEIRERSDGPASFESFVAYQGAAPEDDEVRLARGREPTLTPGGDWIVFASPTSAGYRLRRMRPDGTSRVPMGELNPGGPDERMPSVSPDGSHVAFIQDTGGSRRLAIRRFDGKRGRVMFSKGWSEFPVW